MNPGFDSTSRNGRRAGLHHCLNRNSVDGPFTRQLRLAHRSLDRMTRFDSELCREQRATGRELSLRSDIVAVEPIQTDEQCLVVLVERTHCGGPHCVTDRRVQRSLRQRSERSLVQDRFRRGRNMTLLRQQPRLERRAILNGQAFQQLSTETTDGAIRIARECV